MKKSISFINLVVFLLFFINIVYAIDPEYTVDTNTIGLYHFNEISGNIAYDETGNYNGILMNGETRSTNSPFISNSSLDLDGVDDYVSINSNLLNNLPRGTFESYVYIKNIKSNGSWVDGCIIVSKGTSAMTDIMIEITENFKLAAHMGTGLYFISNQTINLNQWYKIALTWDGIKWKFYIDDVFDSETFATEIPINSANEVKIGRHNHGAGPLFCDGLIDEVRISNIAREFNSILDLDNDTIEDNTDNCINIYNPLQEDIDNDTIGDACDSINGNIDNSTIEINNSTNLTQQYNGTLTVILKQAMKTVVEFQYNFTEAPLNLMNISIEKEPASATKAYIMLKGLTLQNNNTKTLYMNRLNTNLNYVCIKDAEINDISEISSNCQGSNEYLVPCNGNNFKNYTCTKTADNYVITGLKHSAVKEIETYVKGKCDGYGVIGPGDRSILIQIMKGQEVHCYYLDGTERYDYLNIFF